MPGLERRKEIRVTTPFGSPSDLYVLASLGDAEVVFLPRHGRGHRWLPTEVNFRANIFGMKKLGVGWIISVSAVGSLKEEIAPGHIVVPDQFIDRTTRRHATFFGGGVVAHVGFADPFCPALRAVVYEAAVQAGAQAHGRGTYLCMEGPQFSSRAESLLYRSWGADVIGMTNVQEAKLAREAEICFATIALATDYDCWNESAEEVEIERVLAILKENTELAQRIIRRAVDRVADARSCACSHSLRDAIITDRKMIPAKIRRDLKPILGKYLGRDQRRA
jgi:5'-methylthioadenosine phosphorylase